MEKKLYAKPLMSVEQFTPSEYVATCWYVKSGSCYNALYHDIKIVFGGNGHDGIYNSITSADDENMYYGISHSNTSHRIPTGNNEYFNTKNGEAIPQNIRTDNYYYTGYNWRLEFTGNVTGEIFKVTDKSGGIHYVKEIQTAGNHS